MLHKLLCKPQRHILMSPMYAANVIYGRWLWAVKFAVGALEGTVASEVGIPGCLHIPIGRSRME
jgi:hypothetical protein